MDRKWYIHFHTACVEIISLDGALSNYLDILFIDTQGAKHRSPVSSFEVSRINEQFNVFKNGVLESQQSNEVEAASAVMNSVKFELINNIDDKLAVHAALVSDSTGSILLPGTSGAGKSSLTAWLAKHGFYYHTDELVLIDLESLELIPFTRPLMVKSHGLDATLEMLEVSPSNRQLMLGNYNSSIPHRLINSEYISTPPPLKAIILPAYSKSGNSQCKRLSKAQAIVELMRSNVLARNLPSHGTKIIQLMVGSVPTFQCQYSNFDQLPTLLSDCDLYSA